MNFDCFFISWIFVVAQWFDSGTHVQRRKRSSEGHMLIKLTKKSFFFFASNGNQTTIEHRDLVKRLPLTNTSKSTHTHTHTLRWKISIFDPCLSIFVVQCFLILRPVFVPFKLRDAVFFGCLSSITFGQKQSITGRPNNRPTKHPTSQPTYHCSQVNLWVCTAHRAKNNGSFFFF